jgi:hypothetical protein
MSGLPKDVSTKSRKPEVLLAYLQRFGSFKKKPQPLRPQSTSQVLDL